MAEQIITYAISTDFSAGVDSTRLDAEVSESSIVPALTNIETDGDVCKLTFADTLSGPEQTTLGMPPTPGGGTIIGDHDGSKLPDAREVMFLATGASAGSTGTAVDVPLASSVPALGPLLAISPYSLSNNVVTVAEAGLYMLIAEATVEASVAGTGETWAEVFLEEDSGGYSTILGSKSRASFIGKTLNEPDSTSATVVVVLAAGTKVRMRLNRLSGDATVATVANQARLMIVALRRD
jgi:hypothetical protein